MPELTSFSHGVAEKIGYYVYRLIDPRNGQTFYVGKGKGDRVFQHIQETLKFNDDDEDALTLKLKTIRDIHQAGLEVIQIIHRHGMDEDTAFEVEAALIDAYAGLTNIQGGHGSSDRGPMNVQQLNAVYTVPAIPPATIVNNHCVIIKIRQATVDSNNGDIYKTVRYAWRLGQPRIDKLNATPNHIILAVINGIVKGVYTNVKWKQVTDGDAAGRYEFYADEADDTTKGLFIGQLIDGQYRVRGLADPVILTW